MGSLAAAGAAGIGTGAFTSTRADRAVKVDVTGDGNSYLGLIPNDDVSVVSTASDGTMSIDLGSDSGHGGTGVSNDAVTRIWPAFQVRNQGSETIYVEIDNPLANSDLTDGGVDLQFLACDDASDYLLDGNQPVLFDRTARVESVGGWEIGNPTAIPQTEASNIPRAFKGSTKGGSRGPPMHLGLDPGQDVDVIVRVFAMVDDPSAIDLSDEVTFEAYTDESKMTIPDGEDWLGD
jgi:hypothetical protein